MAEWALLPIALPSAIINVKRKITPANFAGPRGRWPPENPDQREGKLMSITLFFFGLIMGIVFGWITLSLLINLRLIWHGPVDQGSLSRQGLTEALAQTPRTPR
jgi:hypothetical protein